MEYLEQQIEGVVDAILEDYRHERDIDKLDILRLPDKDVVIDVIQKLRRIVFPGFSRDKNYRIYNAKYNLSMLIEDVMFHLSRQIALVLQSEGGEKAASEERGRELCMAFLRTIPSVRAVVQTDLQASYDGDPAATSCDEIIFSCYHFAVIFAYDGFCSGQFGEGAGRSRVIDVTVGVQDIFYVMRIESELVYVVDNSVKSLKVS